MIDAIQNSAYAVWVRESPSIWAYTTILSLHAMGLAITPDDAKPSAQNYSVTYKGLKFVMVGDSGGSMSLLAVMQIARRTGDRYRDFRAKL